MSHRNISELLENLIKNDCTIEYHILMWSNAQWDKRKIVLVKTNSSVTKDNTSAARQKGLSSCVPQKHVFRDNRICSV